MKWLLHLKTSNHHKKLASGYIRYLCCCLIVCMLMTVISVTAAAAPAQKMPSGIDRSQVQAIIEDFWNKNEKTAVGMAAAVFDRDGIIYQNQFGFANREKKIKLTGDSVLEWGSASKTLIWVSAMQLSEQGKLDLQKDIRSYLPEGFLTHLHFDTPITMLHLMNHTAGFGDQLYAIESPFAQDVMPLGDYLRIYQPDQAFEPGTVCNYSNWGAALAGYVVERVSGQSYADYVQAHIFKPLGIQHAALLPDLSDNPAVAAERKKLEGYTADGEWIENSYRYILLYPAGMCTSTLSDFCTYAQALADPHSALFQKEATYQEMISPSAYLGDTDIAVNAHGFWLCQFADGVIGHNGNTSTCSSQMQWDVDSGVGMVVLTNQQGERHFTLDMTYAIMGKTTVSHHEGVNATVLGSNAIMHGPMKLYSLVGMEQVTEDMFEHFVCARQTNDKVDKIAMQGMDYLILSDADAAGMIIPVILWITAAIFAFIALWIKLIRLIIRSRHKTDRTIPLGKWSAVSSVLIIVPLMLLMPCVLSLSDGAQWSIAEYQSWSICYLAAAAALAGLIIGGLILMIRHTMTMKRRIYCIVTMLLMGVVIYNILYWQLYMFWLI